MKKQRYLWWLGAGIFWVTTTSFVGLINNYFYYLSKETEIEPILAQQIQTIGYVYRSVPESSFEEEINTFSFYARNSVLIKHYTNDTVDWQIENNIRKETDRTAFIREGIQKGKKEGQSLHIQITAYVTPPWWKALLRAWLFSFWETDGWLKYRLFQRSLPLYAYGFAVAVFGWILKKILDRINNEKIKEAETLAATAKQSLISIEAEKQKIEEDKNALIEKEKKNEQDRLILENNLLNDLSERESRVFEEEERIKTTSRFIEEEKIRLEEWEKSVKKREQEAICHLENTEKTLSIVNQNRRKILLEVIGTETWICLDTDARQKVQLGYHGQYPNYKEAVDKIQNIKLDRDFTSITDCAYNGHARKTITVVKDENYLELILENDSGCGLHLYYKPKYSKYSSPLGYTLAILLKYAVKDYDDYKIKIV